MDKRQTIIRLEKQLNKYLEVFNVLSKYKNTIFYHEVSEQLKEENFKFKELICEIEHNLRSD